MRAEEPIALTESRQIFRVKDSGAQTKAEVAGLSKLRKRESDSVYIKKINRHMRFLQVYL